MTIASWYVVYMDEPGNGCIRGGTPVASAHARLASGEREEAQRMAAAALVVFAERGSAAGLHRVRGVRDAFREAGHHAAALALDEQVRAVRVAARG
jgi:hypothetical protein